MVNVIHRTRGNKFHSLNMFIDTAIYLPFLGNVFTTKNHKKRIDKNSNKVLLHFPFTFTVHPRRIVDDEYENW